MPSKNNQDEGDVANANNVDCNRKVRIRKRRYHPTPYGRRCVNAVTGVSYPWQTGSYEEMRLYKVADATGFYTKEGFLRELNDKINSESNFLYFDSPEQYARHMRVDINPEYCATWHARVSRLFPEDKFDRDAYEAEKANCDGAPEPQLVRNDDAFDDSLEKLEEL